MPRMATTSAHQPEPTPAAGAAGQESGARTAGGGEGFHRPTVDSRIAPAGGDAPDPDDEMMGEAPANAIPESPFGGPADPAPLQSRVLSPEDEPAAGRPEAELPAGPAPAGSSLNRMAQLRRLVRQDGLDPVTAAQELGVDPIIAQLWLRLPDDLWPTGQEASQGDVVGVPGTSRGALPPPGVPLGGLRRVLTCRVPSPAIDRLRTAGGTIVEGAAAALEAGLGQSLPPVAPGGWRFPRRPLAVPIPAETYTAVLQLAQDAFRGDPRDAAGWLIARGTGIPLPLPTEDELTATPSWSALPPAERLVTTTPVRFVVPPRRRPETRAPLPADDSAPSGEELRRRRDAAGLSQRDLAAASGLSRGLVAEIERGRRRHVLTRLKLAETLAAVEQNKPAQTAT